MKRQKLCTGHFHTHGEEPLDQLEVNVSTRGSGVGNRRLSHRRIALGQVAASVVGLGVVETTVHGLEKEHGVGCARRREADSAPQAFADCLVHTQSLDNQGTRDEDDENDQHDEIENGETDDTSLPELGLLKGVDGWTDLTTGLG